jgi:hypothetical protein
MMTLWFANNKETSMKNIFMTAVILSAVLTSTSYAQSNRDQVRGELEAIKAAGVEVFAKAAQVLAQQLNTASIENQYPVHISDKDASNGYKYTAVKSFALANGFKCRARFAEKEAVNVSCVDENHEVSSFLVNPHAGMVQRLNPVDAAE